MGRRCYQYARKDRRTPVRVVADVREATAEAGILYGAEFTGGTGTKLLDAASTKQETTQTHCRGCASVLNAGRAGSRPHSSQPAQLAGFPFWRQQLE